jgi:hypothetical protein
MGYCYQVSVTEWRTPGSNAEEFPEACWRLGTLVKAFMKKLCGRFKESSIQSRYIMPPAKKPLFLRPEHIAILMAIWKNFHNGDKLGLRRRDLRKQLVRDEKKQSGTEPGDRISLSEAAGSDERIFASAGTLYAQIGDLKKLKNLVETNTTYSGGKPSDIYTIALENAVTWPTTARILVEIHAADDLSIEEDVLTAKIKKMRLKRSADGLELSESAMKNAIAWASDDKRDPAYIRREGDILTARPRLKFEIEYLRAVAACVRTV